LFTSGDVPDVWLTDRIDPNELATLQQQQFPEEYAEAARDEDDSCFVLEGGLLYSKAPPSRAADSYLRLILPHEHCEKVIERCHSEVGHFAFTKTICRVQEHYVWPGCANTSGNTFSIVCFATR
jgi:hypothetical protein